MHGRSITAPSVPLSLASNSMLIHGPLIKYQLLDKTKRQPISKGYPKITPSKPSPMSLSQVTVLWRVYNNDQNQRHKHNHQSNQGHQDNRPSTSGKFASENPLLAVKVSLESQQQDEDANA